MMINSGAFRTVRTLEGSYILVVSGFRTAATNCFLFRSSGFRRTSHEQIFNDACMQKWQRFQNDPNNFWEFIFSIQSRYVIGANV
jgi:hypothetical protein